MLVILIIIVIIIIAFKGAIQDFLQPPHCTANRLQHVRSSGPGAIMCNLHATQRALNTCNISCYVPLGTKRQLSFVLLAEPLTDEGHYQTPGTMGSGAGIMEADDHQVTTVFTVQPSFHHRHSTNRVS